MVEGVEAPARPVSRNGLPRPPRYPSPFSTSRCAYSRRGCLCRLTGLQNTALSIFSLTVWKVTNVNVAPDGFSRATIQAGAFPGKLITCNKGDTLHINVTNSLVDPTMRRSTSIHWHGIFQSRTSSEDGPSFVNQCPIPPGMFYQYNFPVLDQTGTYWYHSHLSTQYIDGERGTLVIYDPNDPHKGLYDIDNAGTVITLADWYHAPAEALMEQFVRDGHEPVPDSGLINGVGRYKGGPAVPWAVISVVQGKRYRFRVVNIAGFAAFTFSIDNHQFQVIETDGILTVPLTTSSFEIHAAQRYSIVLNANQPVSNYWVRAPMEVAGSSSTLDKDNVKAILRYTGAPIRDPTTSSKLAADLVEAKSGGQMMEEYQLQTLINPGAPGGSGPADHVIDLTFGTLGSGIWDINGIAYASPRLPTLLQIINGATNASDFTTSEHTIILKPDEVVELRIQGSNHGITHPFHLHGHVFDVVKGISGPTNYVNPPRRDVVGVDGGGVIIRFRADNPGPWFLHCHIDWHLEAGLAVVFAEDPAGIRSGPKSNIIPAPWRNLCPAYYALAPEFQ
ncbi:Laccase 17 [Mycena indigotica]|uniref:Laccase 17 n=1 Tax=Mycena indigotica TaxID=2126181 RepID=A0A8H6S388_9AGAR|nr:Laccase 17 [Mycena indigotica]KAF7291435.1 Laccase 17 [Mycena indigotica]